MNTKFVKAVYAMAILIICTSTSLFAQDDDLAFIQKLWGQQKKDIIIKYMKFSTEESGKFWAVYDQYEAERKSISAERIALLEDYAKNYTGLSDAKADELTNKIFANNIKMDKVQKKYYNKMKKVLTPLRASEFMQLETYLQTMIRYQVQSNIPFIGDIDKIKQ